MRVIVVGGGGYLGERAVAALRSMTGIDVSSASRSSDPRLDLADRGTFGAVDGADVVVDLADAGATPPDELAAHCLERGVTFVETSADRTVVERLHQRFAEHRGPGALVLCAGIFPGLSNLLARAASERVGRCRSLSLAIRSSPFSGAGASTVDLMVAAFRTQTLSFEDGQPVLSAPVAKGPRFPFPSGEAPSLHVPLADTYLIHRSTGVGDVKVHLSPSPSILAAAYLAIPAFVLKSSLFRWFMKGYFTFLRRWLLSRRPSPVEMVAIAEGDGGRVVHKLHTDDGMLAGGHAIAVMAAELGKQKEKLHGVAFIDDVLSLTPTVDRIREVAGARLSLDVST